MPSATADRVAHLPPVSILFAAFLGYNPIEHLLGPHALAALSARTTARPLTGRSFFPHLISGPFRNGLHEAFAFAIVACLVAAAASLMRGSPYRPDDEEPERTQHLHTRAEAARNRRSAKVAVGRRA